MCAIRAEVQPAPLQENDPQLYERVRGLRGDPALIAFPNLFLTVTAAEWKFPRRRKS